MVRYISFEYVEPNSKGIMRTLPYLLLTFVAACGSGHQTEPPVTPSEPLNDFLRGASFQVINLDDHPADTLLITAEMILTEEVFLDEDLYLNRPNGIIFHRDYLILNDFMSPNVIAIDPETAEPLFRIGGEGRGPGEFIQPFEIMSDGENLYIHDTSLMRISVFDSDFRFVESFPFESIMGSPNDVKAVMNGDFLVYENGFSSGLFSATGNETMLEVAAISKPDSVLHHLMPRVVPSGMQPGAHNRFNFTLSRDHRLAALYNGLPFLFLFDRFEHHHTVQFLSEDFEKLDNPPLTPFAPRGNDGERVSGAYITQLYLPDGELLLMARTGLYRFLIEDDHAELISRIHLEADGFEDTGIRGIRGITYHPNDPRRLYVIGWEQIYSFRLPEI